MVQICNLSTKKAKGVDGQFKVSLDYGVTLFAKRNKKLDAVAIAFDPNTP